MTTEDQTAAAQPLLDDALAFAERVFSEALADHPRLARRAPREFAAYDAALARLRELQPGANGRGPLALLDEAAPAWGQAAFWQGARCALEADRLRRSLLAMATEPTGAA